MTAAWTRERAENRIRELEAGMERLAGDSAPDPLEKAGRLSAFEVDFLEDLPRIAEVDEDLAEQTGHPVLGDGSAWRDLAAEAAAPEAARAADDLIARLIADAASAWQPEVDGTDPDSYFRALADARAFDLEALARRTTDLAPLSSVRPALRASFLASLWASPPSDELRDAWSTELVDRADVVLTSIDDVDPARAQALLDLVADDLDWHLRSVATGKRKARLRAKIRRLRAEQQERDLQHKLEARFGRERVAAGERIVLWLILLVLGLLAIEEILEPPDEYVFWIHLADTLCCVVFLTEFFVKLRIVQGRARWFARHFFVDFLPSIPFSFLLRWLRALRFIRIMRVARYLRVARPFIRGLRALGFLIRGMDRMVRKYGSLLNRNIVLYPTREERARAARGVEHLGHRVRTIQSRLNDRWERLLTTAPHDAREAVAVARVNGLESAREAGYLRRADHRHEAVADVKDLIADDLLERLGTITDEEVEAQTGGDFVSRLARAVRLLRWFPVIRKYLPRVSPRMEDAEVVAEAAHSASARLRRHYDRWFWFADLYGTVTPAQFLDRVGTTMVKAAFRPAYRLFVVWIIYLITVGFLAARGSQLKTPLENTIGVVIHVVGGICLGILFVGWWLRRIAGQATDFFAKLAKAQYISLTESIKSRHIRRDGEIFDRHVFRPERSVTGHAEDGTQHQEAFATGVRSWLLEAQASLGARRGFDPVERAVFIYRDGLDGALLCDTDTRTTGQLLGTPALRNLRILSARFDRADRKALQRLDLERQKQKIGGPYLWFSLICQAVAHGVARLIVDYNRHCLPLDQIDRASPEERSRYDAWLAAEHTEKVSPRQVLYVSTEFTALHFLDDDPARDSDVAERYGEKVLARIRRDRRHLFRRIFGTYPLHQRPRDERVLNLYRIYHSWFAGGRVLLLPLRAFWIAIRFVGRLFHWLGRCIREVRRPSFDVDEKAAEGADFRTAVRKIQRMRAPVAESAVRLRALFDAEYLGLQLPGMESSGLQDADARSDLRFLAASPVFEREIDMHRRHAARDVVQLSRLIDGGLFERIGVEPTREHVRAAAWVYVGDLKMVRRLLSAQEILSETYERAARRDVMPRLFWPHPGLYA
ncbi:MAG: ion transporter, partial [Planctomycetota bacterium]